MTIQLPEHLEHYVQDQVRAGRFLTEDLVILDALERHRRAEPILPITPTANDPLLGSMREDADLLDEIVAQAMNGRRRHS